MLNWILTKWKIYKFHRKHGAYHNFFDMDTYNNFYVNEDDMDELMSINNKKRKNYGFIIKSKI